MSDLTSSIMEQSTFRARRILELQEEKQKLVKALESIQSTIECIDDKHYTASDAIYDIRSSARIAILNAITKEGP